MAKVLVVDDSELMLKALVRQLQIAGHEAVGESEPRKALLTVLRSKPQVVLLDVNIPDFDGPQFCRTASGQTTILLHSSQAESQLQETCTLWGAHGYIVKSWTPAQKIAAIDERVSALPAQTA